MTSRPFLVYTGVLCILLAVNGEKASAQEEAPPSPKKPVTGLVSYQNVDAATVRIFAIGKVGVERISLGERGPTISVATPKSGHGSGFIVGDSGLILTAQHVVDGARHVVVRLPGQIGFTAARVVVTSKQADVAVLAIEKKTASVTLSSDTGALPVRQTVFAIGYPNDPTRTQAQSSRGIVAGALDNGTVQLDISVNPGNSGGPVVNEKHEVVGMLVARGNVDAGVVGLGIAVPRWKLHRALAESRKRIAAGKIAPLSVSEKEAAGVVDILIQQGALHVLSEGEDLNSAAGQMHLEEDLETFFATIKDPDLLVYVAGNLWNAHLILKFGKIDTLNGKRVSKTAVAALSNKFLRQAIELTNRAKIVDTQIAYRSAFASIVPTTMRQSPGQSPYAQRAVRPYANSTQDTPVSIFSKLITRKNVWQLQSQLSLFSDDESIAVGGGIGVEFRLARTHSESEDSRTRLVYGIGVLYSGAERSKAADVEQSSSDYTTKTITFLRTLYGELGLSHTFGQTRTAMYVEIDWLPGVVRRNISERREYGYLSDTPDNNELLSSRSTLELLQTRLILGWHPSRNWRVFGSGRILVEGSGRTSAWFGVGTALSL